MLKDRDTPQDPIALRRQRQKIEVAKPTFAVYSERLLSDIESEWRNAKHAGQWHNTLKQYCKIFWNTPVDKIETDDVLAALRPIWKKKYETARRVRGRVERVLDAATAHGLRTGANPARWKGHLAHLLPKRLAVDIKHHAAMPYLELPRFVRRLRERQGDGMSALGLEFLILCASRSGEVLGMRWEEVDLENKLWTIPAKRMKAAREHRVPLSVRSVAILTFVRPMAIVEILKNGEQRPTGFVFRGPRGGAMSVMVFTMLMRRMNVGEFTPHGFRSAFRDWVGEETDFARETAEAALAHTVGDATERAYRRGDALEKRRKLMEAWGDFLK